MTNTIMPNAITTRVLFAVILTVLAVFLSACGGKTIYYQYKAGESNWHAASTKCKAQAEQAKYGVKDVRSNNIFNPNANFAAKLATNINEGFAARAAYNACLAELGWLPCSEGGTASHGCKSDSSSVTGGNILPLHTAIWKGDIAEGKRLIKGGANVNAKSDEGNTPLHGAVWKGQTEIVFALIKAGADIDAKDNNGLTPLHIAAEHGQTEIADALIKAGADIEAKEKDGATPLHYAAWKGQTEAADVFIKAGANLFARSDNGKTPLAIAIEENGKDSKIARLLREAMEKQGG